MCKYIYRYIDRHIFIYIYVYIYIYIYKHIYIYIYIHICIYISVRVLLLTRIYLHISTSPRSYLYFFFDCIINYLTTDNRNLIKINFKQIKVFAQTYSTLTFKQSVYK